MKLLPLLLLLLCACEKLPELDWEAAPRTHACTDEQMKKVERESSWCTENTGWIKNYCYGSAIIRNCEKMEKP